MSTQVVIVEFVKTGGIMGLNQKMEISNDGHGIISGAPNAKPYGFDLSEEEMDELRETLDAAGFPKYAGQEFPCEGSADRFSYAVTYGGETVSMCEDRIPEELSAAVDLLDSIARAHGGV